MARTRVTRAKVGLVAAASSALIAGGLTTATMGTAAAATTCGAVFDDFNYSSATDASFTGNGWETRGESGGPGVSGATWSAKNITFPTVDGQKVAQLSASTNGTASGTVQAEFLQTGERFKEGTYASRIKFHDAPTSGTDGDHINQTFFAIGPAQRYDYDPLYSELDFSEYLPNGGWGTDGPTNYQTSYNGFREDPWDARNKESSENASFDGWHNLVTQVADGHVKYYIDGVLEGDHTVDGQTGTYSVYPRQSMTVDYNMWLIDTAGHSGGVSTYDEQVDWFYYAKNEVVSPADAVTRANAYRSAGTTHTDSLDAGTTCTTATPTGTTPAAAPTATPSATASAQPTATPTPTASFPAITPPPVTPINCVPIAEWRRRTLYLAGQRALHKDHLWEATQRTRRAEPGRSSQWKDVGACPS